MTPELIELQPSDWQYFAERASEETDGKKLRAVVQLMIYALWLEQRHIKDDIRSRLDYRFNALQHYCVSAVGST